LLIGTPACVFWVSENRPPKGFEPRPRSWGHLLTDRKLAILCLAVALTIGPVVGLLSQLQPLLTGKGVMPATAAKLGSVLALAVFGGTLLTGWLVDRIWAPFIGCLIGVGACMGCFLLLEDSLTLWRAASAVVLIGVTQGAELDLAGYLIARYFGVNDFAAIFGLTILAIGLGSAGSTMAFAFTFDQWHSYALALQASMAAFMLATLSYLGMGRYPRRAAQTAVLPPSTDSTWPVT